MITSMHIQNFKCFKDFKIDLDPFTVLIGPNDSGKTAFLQGVRLIGAVASKGVAVHVDSVSGSLGGAWRTEVLWRNNASTPLLVEADLVFREGVPGSCSVRIESQLPHAGNFPILCRSIPKGQHLPSAPSALDGSVLKQLGSIGYYSFSPAALRLPSPLSDQMFSMSPTGKGFPSFLDDINRAETESYIALKKEFCKRFPEYRGIIVGKQRDTRPVALRLEFATRHDEILPAGSVSDGALLSLAFLAMCYLPDPPKIMLVEEPENGVHHARLKEIVETLRQLNRDKGVQIIVTTHSPYLLDLVEPEEVRVFAKDEEGAVHQKKLSEYPDVEQMKKDFMTGEIWTMLGETQRI